MRVVYTGPLDMVEFSNHGRWVVVSRGESVEVDNELGKSLTEQSCWDEAKAAPVSAGTKATENGDKS